MSETRDAPTDDAPASTAKSRHARDKATDALVDAKGCENGCTWDNPAVPERWVEWQLLSGADNQSLPDRHSRKA